MRAQPGRNPPGTTRRKRTPGWAFFNVNGYLGTVTPEGEVITEDQFADDDTDDD